MSRAKNTRNNYFQEIAGLRIVKMFIEEYFHWGFQLIDQENDDGLDGFIIVHDKSGADTGARIHCQIKCGHSYLKRETEDFLYIQPYSPKSNLVKHLDTYSKMVEPTVLFYINPGKIRPDGTYEYSKRNPPCWWLRLDDYKHDGGSQVYIPKKNTFGEHSKGDLYRMVRPLLKNWNNFPLLVLEPTDRKIFYSLNLLTDAKSYYKSMKDEGILKLIKNNKEVRITRIGWRHINKKSRGAKRINTSLRLLPVAKRVIEKYSSKLIFLKEKTTHTVQCKDRYYGLRVRLNIENNEKKVQVVLRNWINPQKGLNLFWFYSVHIIK